MYVCVIKTPISHISYSNKMENQVDKLKLEDKLLFFKYRIQ